MIPKNRKMQKDKLTGDQIQVANAVKTEVIWWG